MNRMLAEYFPVGGSAAEAAKILVPAGRIGGARSGTELKLCVEGIAV